MMKYLVLLCDGMADYPFQNLGGKTPMELADKPNMDKLAKTALIGTAKTVADNLKPGSDVANLSVMTPLNVIPAVLRQRRQVLALTLLIQM